MFVNTYVVEIKYEFEPWVSAFLKIKIRKGNQNLEQYNPEVDQERMVFY